MHSSFPASGSGSLAAGRAACEPGTGLEDLERWARQLAATEAERCVAEEFAFRLQALAGRATAGAYEPEPESSNGASHAPEAKLSPSLQHVQIPLSSSKPAGLRNKENVVPLSVSQLSPISYDQSCSSSESRSGLIADSEELTSVSRRADHVQAQIGRLRQNAVRLDEQASEHAAAAKSQASAQALYTEHLQERLAGLVRIDQQLKAELSELHEQVGYRWLNSSSFSDTFQCSWLAAGRAAQARLPQLQRELAREEALIHELEAKSREQSSILAEHSLSEREAAAKEEAELSKVSEELGQALAREPQIQQQLRECLSASEARCDRLSGRLRLQRQWAQKLREECQNWNLRMGSLKAEQEQISTSTSQAGKTACQAEARQLIVGAIQCLGSVGELHDAAGVEDLTAAACAAAKAFKAELQTLLRDLCSSGPEAAWASAPSSSARSLVMMLREVLCRKLSACAGSYFQSEPPKEVSTVAPSQRDYSSCMGASSLLEPLVTPSAVVMFGGRTLREAPATETCVAESAAPDTLSPPSASGSFSRAPDDTSSSWLDCSGDMSAMKSMSTDDTMTEHIHTPMRPTSKTPGTGFGGGSEMKLPLPEKRQEPEIRGAAVMQQVAYPSSLASTPGAPETTCLTSVEAKSAAALIATRLPAMPGWGVSTKLEVPVQDGRFTDSATAPRLPGCGVSVERIVPRRDASFADSTKVSSATSAMIEAPAAVSACSAAESVAQDATYLIAQLRRASSQRRDRPLQQPSAGQQQLLLLQQQQQKQQPVAMRQGSPVLSLSPQPCAWQLLRQREQQLELLQQQLQAAEPDCHGSLGHRQIKPWVMPERVQVLPPQPQPLAADGRHSRVVAGHSEPPMQLDQGQMPSQTQLLVEPDWNGNYAYHCSKHGVMLDEVQTPSQAQPLAESNCYGSHSNQHSKPQAMLDQLQLPSQMQPFSEPDGYVRRDHQYSNPQAMSEKVRVEALAGPGRLLESHEASSQAGAVDSPRACLRRARSRLLELRGKVSPGADVQ